MMTKIFQLHSVRKNTPESEKRNKHKSVESLISEMKETLTMIEDSLNNTGSHGPEDSNCRR